MSAARGVSRAAMQGATNEELVREALLTLSAAGDADRAGVWIDSGLPEVAGGKGAARFRGKVWDRESECLPQEWERISPEAPLPLERLLGGESTEWKSEVAGAQPFIGPLIAMGHALWVPIAGSGQLRGLLLIAQRNKNAQLARSLAENVAAEVALALENALAQRMDRECQADLSLTRRILTVLATPHSGDEILTGLLKECTVIEPPGVAPGAAFAAIGRTGKTDETSAGKLQMDFSWKSGSEVWTHAIESEPLSRVWQNAVTTRRIAATVPHVAWMRNEVARVVAVPLECEGEIIGVLIVGLRPQISTRGTQERLELRATLAASALRQIIQEDEEVKRRAWQQPEQGSGREEMTPPANSLAAKRRERDETELREALEWVEEGVVVFDGEESVRVLNTRFAQMIGLSVQECASLRTLGTLITRIAPQTAQPESFAKSWRAVTREADGARAEVHIAMPVPRVLERMSRPLLDKAGHSLGRVEIYRDVTAERVFQAQLLQTEKLAALGQMISGMAHELSNPLTTILGTAQRLLVSPEAIGRSGEVQQIFREADRAGKILRQLLLSSRDARPETQRVSLNQVVFRAAELQRFQMSSHTIRVEQQLDPLLPYVQGDAGQLQQVLINLIGNAQQAIEQSGQGGVIQVRTKRLGAERVLLEVRDDGPGITKSILPRIFDPFFTTKPAGVGTGLGLAVVWSVVRDHGGQVQVSSEPGEGTTFSIELPAVAAGSAAKFRGAAEQAPRPALREPRAASLPSAVGSGREYVARALVVEDEPTVARLIADVLEDEGLQVDVTLDGREALQRAASENYEMVICDMRMPGVNGQHFFKALKQTQNPLRERLLFVTGDVITPHTQQFLERNQLPHVAKPFRVEELQEAVRQLLGGKAAQLRSEAAAAKKHAARNG